MPRRQPRSSSRGRNRGNPRTGPTQRTNRSPRQTATVNPLPNDQSLASTSNTTPTIPIPVSELEGTLASAPSTSTPCRIRTRRNAVSSPPYSPTWDDIGNLPSPSADDPEPPSGNVESVQSGQGSKRLRRSAVYSLPSSSLGNYSGSVGSNVRVTINRLNEDAEQRFSQSERQVAVPPPSQNATTRQVYLVRKHLAQLLHSNKCRKLARFASQCTFRYCETLTTLLVHMDSCEEENACTFDRCWPSRKLTYHWDNCTNTDCTVCSPIRHTNAEIVSFH